VFSPVCNCRLLRVPLKSLIHRISVQFRRLPAHSSSNPNENLAPSSSGATSQGITLAASFLRFYRTTPAIYRYNALNSPVILRISQATTEMYLANGDSPMSCHRSCGCSSCGCGGCNSCHSCSNGCGCDTPNGFFQVVLGFLAVLFVAAVLDSAETQPPTQPATPLPPIEQRY